MAKKHFFVGFDTHSESFVETNKTLRSCTPGSLPFIPLTKPPEDCNREEWLSKCVSVAHEITPREHLPNLLFSMSVRFAHQRLRLMVLSGLVISDTDAIEIIIPEEIMKESAYYQHIVNKARAEGLAEGESLGIVEALLALIRKRFTPVPRTISQKIKSIRDKSILLNIQELAIYAKTQKEFIEAFNALNI